jgi:hypothetical protein
MIVVVIVQMVMQHISTQGYGRTRRSVESHISSRNRCNICSLALAAARGKPQLVENSSRAMQARTAPPRLIRPTTL